MGYTYFILFERGYKGPISALIQYDLSYKAATKISQRE